MDDLKDNPKEIAEDIIKQAKMGFNIEAEKRILNILKAYRAIKVEIDVAKRELNIPIGE